MKIAFIDFEFDYGNPARGINEISEYGFRRIFENLGHEVVPFYYDKYLGEGLPGLQRDVVQFVKRVKPDLAFFMLHTEEFSVTTIEEISKVCPTVNWFGDDTWRFENFSAKYAPAFSHVITTDPFSVPKYHKLGIKNVHLSQWAALDGTPSSPITEGFKYDVTFVGMANAPRRWWVKELAKRGIVVQTFGFGWPYGRCSLEQMSGIFRYSRINLNLSNSRSLDFRFLIAGWRNLANALVNRKIESQIKARCFEVPYAGGFQLCDYTPFLDRYLKIGEEVACYTTIEDLAELILYYLENETERIEIAKRAHERVCQEHTYFHRLSKIFQWVSKI